MNERERVCVCLCMCVKKQGEERVFDRGEYSSVVNDVKYPQNSLPKFLSEPVSRIRTGMRHSSLSFNKFFSFSSSAGSLEVAR
jgi:hypothetical protein